MRSGSIIQATPCTAFPPAEAQAVSISVATFFIQPLNGARFYSEADLHFRTARATVAAMKDSHTVSHAGDTPRLRGNSVDLAAAGSPDSFLCSCTFALNHPGG